MSTPTTSKPCLRQIDRIGARAAADLQRAAGRDGVRLNHLDEHRIGRAGIPWQRLGRGVAVVPGRMRHAAYRSAYRDMHLSFTAMGDPVTHKVQFNPSTGLSRRELLAGAGAGAAALVLEQRGLRAQVPRRATPVVFSHVAVVNADAVQDDVAVAIEGDRIAAIGPTDGILAKYPGAEVYDGRGKALLPGLINCHAHMAAVLERGFNEDFGFPNSAHLAFKPASLLKEKKTP